MYKEAALDHTCLDVFGWATDFLFLVRNTPFLRQVARLCARIGSADVPDSVAAVLTCGGLLALHKESPKEQAARAARGLKPKLRPVNIGSALLKWSFKCALRDQAPQDAAKKMEHIQLGLGAGRGVERVAHLFTALWNKLYAHLGIDFENGFNDLSRQAMLHAVQKRCPQLTPLFNLFYARDSLCFFTVEGDVRVVLSQEGSRMGCVLGSFGFDLVVQDVYEAVQALLPAAPVKALTDDLNIAVPPQQYLQEQLRLCGEMFTTVRREAKRVAGLKVNMDKTKVLLPLGPDGRPYDLDTLVLPEGFPADLKLVVDGNKMGGAPVGPDAFVRAFTADALDGFTERLMALPGADPQVAHGLLRTCVSSAPVFLAQVTPPSSRTTCSSGLTRAWWSAPWRCWCCLGTRSWPAARHGASEPVSACNCPSDSREVAWPLWLCATPSRTSPLWHARRARTSCSPRTSTGSHVLRRTRTRACCRLWDRRRVSQRRWRIWYVERTRSCF